MKKAHACICVCVCKGQRAREKESERAKQCRWPLCLGRSVVKMWYSDYQKILVVVVVKRPKGKANE